MEVSDQTKAAFSHGWASLVPELQRAGLRHANLEMQNLQDLPPAALLDRWEVLVCGNICTLLVDLLIIMRF